uniref:Leucine-rich repeat transmembrane protein kinase n=1 Tax=Populus tomentosa TaxID=118781 RepID=A0A172CHI3_POPTO|nr:leucine-rich repeat transmembrane protein kinase [Populus tomentosa]
MLLFFFFLGFTATTVSPATEKEILLQFKANISNDPYNSLANWVPSGNPCDYNGVFCNPLGFVQRIVLWNTSLSGVLSPALSGLRSLRILTLFGNKFTSNIPQEYAELSTLWKINLSSNALSGFLRELDVSGNALDGEIPNTLDNLTSLEVLDLRRNQLDGSIPETLGSLSNLKLLELSQNNLSGTIPYSLGKLANLKYFNVSSNNLSGPIPSIPKIQAFGTAAFLNNSGLCGVPLDISCSGGGNGTGNGSKKNKVLSNSVIVAIVAAALILTGVCVVSIMNFRARRRKKDNVTTVVESTPLDSTDSNVIIGKLVLFSKTLPSRYEDWEAGTKALLDKECLIGGGSIGTVYRTTFEGGVSIAVKKLETLGRIRSQDEFEQEIGLLGNLRHPNLVAFQGYYWSSTMQLILSEFVPNGNLYDNLHGLNYPGTSTGVGNRELYCPTANEVVVLCEYVRGLLETGSASDCFDRSLRGFSENELIQVMKLGLICTSEVPSRRPSMAEVVQVGKVNQLLDWNSKNYGAGRMNGPKWNEKYNPLLQCSLREAPCSSSCKVERKITELSVNISNVSKIEAVAAVAQQVPSRGNDF